LTVDMEYCMLLDFQVVCCEGCFIFDG
jgi:hypothetical protein